MPADEPEATVAASNASAPLAPAPAPSPPVDAPAAALLTLEGLGPLRIGEPVPTNSGWAERGAQISDECRTVSAPDFPGIYAIVEAGKVRRITLGERSDVKLAGGLGVGPTATTSRSAW